jgi:FXSXX-COOH protein
MSDAARDIDTGLIDLTDVNLEELRKRDDRAFSQALRRIVLEIENDEIVYVSGFQSSI